MVCVSCSAPMTQNAEKPSQDAVPGASVSAPEEAKDGASPPPSAVPGKGEQELERAVRSYEEGAYRNAARQFQVALDLGLRTKIDQANAHKYLAFIGCVSGREKACRDEFRKALEADPGFELAPAEMGHPIWGPVFRSVKAEAASRAKAK
jgi:hypothetical protein